MVILSVLAVMWLGVRVLMLWRLCVRVAEQRYAARSAMRSTGQEASSGPHDAPYGARDTVTHEPRRSSDLADALLAAAVLARALVATIRLLVAWSALLVAAGRWVASFPPDEVGASRPGAEAPEAHAPRTFFDVPPPVSGPACLGGREDGAYLRGWDDAVHWLSNGHDAAPPPWAGVAYMTGWDDAVRAIDRSRLSSRR